jgi:SAM-dependent methyltransferase
MTYDLIPRTTVDEIVGHREKSLELYREAWRMMAEAQGLIDAAESHVRDACGGKIIRPFNERQAPELKAFFNAIDLPDPKQYERTCARLVDCAVWSFLIEHTELESLMDRQAKDDLRDQMSWVPEDVDRNSGQVINQEEIARQVPPVTVEAIQATLQGFAEDSGTIFRRGLANAFSNLDRRFRSHDGFKIGSRMILERCFDHSFSPSLSWNYHQHQRDTLIDIERVLLILDGKDPRATYGGIVGAVEQVSKSRDYEFPVLIQGDYFRLRAFKNGNAHLWFERPDLVEKANKLLAQHYGEVLGDGPGRADEEPDPLENRAVSHARNFGFYPTPSRVVEGICENLNLEHGDPKTILEPSAGTGQIARYLARDRGVFRAHRVDVVEIQPDLAKALREEGLYRRVTCENFLTREAPVVGGYDVVVMNPPFDRERDIDHVSHAWKFLKPGGRLVSIMAAGIEFRETKKSRAFRAFVERYGDSGWQGPWHDLPAGTFREAGTEVNTCWVKLVKPS